MLQRKEPRFHSFLFYSFFYAKNLCRRSQALCSHLGLKVSPDTGQVILQYSLGDVFSSVITTPDIGQILLGYFQECFLPCYPRAMGIGAVGNAAAHGTSQEMV